MRVSAGSLFWAGLCLAGFSVQAQEVPRLPSGLKAEVLEAFVELQPDGVLNYARFRFVVPQIARTENMDPADFAGDFAVLCEQYAVPQLERETHRIDRVVISMSDRPVDFGVSDPEAVQYFEQFSLKDGRCHWEAY
ncbi:DUF6497 family protein [uncultured Lentibacter sp.]|uniref:DUF6497 family protein n=1 Tax=uncultured Lentibacter sp. TaxID=1659309 RepID=UPI003454D188